MIRKIIGIYIIIMLGLSSVDAQEEHKFLPEKEASNYITLVEYPASTKVFPCKWRKKKTNATISPVSTDEIERSNEALLNALVKYPEYLLDEFLDGIYVFRTMSFFGLEYGGTYYKKNVFITNDGIDKGYTRAFIEGTFHHEFSSILLKRNRKFFDRQAWHEANPDDFKYGDGGIAALQTANASLKLDSTLFDMGFLNQYSLASEEEDFNCYAEYIFLSDAGFWMAWKNNEAVREKAAVIIAFFGRLDPQYTLEYFKTLRPYSAEEN